MKGWKLFPGKINWTVSSSTSYNKPLSPTHYNQETSWRLCSIICKTGTSLRWYFMGPYSVAVTSISWSIALCNPGHVTDSREKRTSGKSWAACRPGYPAANSLCRIYDTWTKVWIWVFKCTLYATWCAGNMLSLKDRKYWPALVWWFGTKCWWWWSYAFANEQVISWLLSISPGWNITHWLALSQRGLLDTCLLGQSAFERV